MGEEREENQVKKQLIVGLVIGLAIGAVGTAGATVAIASHSVTACSTKSNALRLNTAKGGCPAGTKAVVIGAAGPRGATGSRGAAGAQGEQGTQGATGTQGAQGAQGEQGPAAAAETDAMTKGFTGTWDGSEWDWGPLSPWMSVEPGQTYLVAFDITVTGDGSDAYFNCQVTVGTFFVQAIQGSDSEVAVAQNPPVIYENTTTRPQPLELTCTTTTAAIPDSTLGTSGWVTVVPYQNDTGP